VSASELATPGHGDAASTSPSAPTDPMPPPLDGITVLDLSQVVSGPICCRVLADLGAAVIKVEPPEGDVIRKLEPRVGDDPLSVYFIWANAGKRSIVVDLHKPEGADLVQQLAKTSDVLVENFRPGVLRKFGLDADTLIARHPRLVYCSINGWGIANSWSQRRAYAAMVQAEVGRVELDARLRGAPLEQSPHVDGDITPGLLAVNAIVAALFQRERVGRGQHLDVSMAEALVYTDEWTSTELAGYQGPRIPDTWKYPVFTVADGTGAAFMGDPHRRLPEVAAALTDVPVPHVESRAEALRILGDLVAAVPDFAELEARLDTFGFLVAEVRTVGQLAETPWATERGVFTEVEAGARVATAPYRSMQSPIGVRGPGPRLGEHTRDVLRERLGLDDGALDILESRQVIGSNIRPAPQP
jgi:CoA:oxalate CoA-transferase